jgi:hypothetical protein
LIEQYFQSILDLLASLPFVDSSDVNLEKRGELVGFVRGRVGFQDGFSLLFFRELIDMRLPLRKIMYAYHYQKADGTLIFRYDNTEHHKAISTFPHHKHSRSGDVTPSEISTLDQVLREIEELISQERG